MTSRCIAEWITQTKIKQVLHAFSVPRTPRQIEKLLGIKKLKMKPFLKKNLLKILNPDARKGRFYVLTNNAKKLLNLPASKNNKDWDLIGWITSSPRQRYVVLITTALDSIKRTSEEIRKRAFPLNDCLSRVSIKSTLNDLVEKELIDTEIGDDRKRYYWITEKGKSIAGNFH